MVDVSQGAGASMDDEPSNIADGLIDVTELSLSDLETIDESTLARALRRVLADEQSEPVAGFQSKI